MARITTIYILRITQSQKHPFIRHPCLHQLCSRMSHRHYHLVMHTVKQRRTRTMTNLTRAPHGSNLVMPCLAHRMYPDHLPCLLDPLTHQLGAVSSPQVRLIVTMQVTVNVDLLSCYIYYTSNSFYLQI